MALLKTKELAEVRVWGIVQGVGFRPFVFRLAHDHNLKGSVRNTSCNVEIEIEGKREDIDDFLNDLEAKSPPMSHIEKIEHSFLPAKGFKSFDILPSRSEEGRHQLVSPDIATCEDCTRELFNPLDRRYLYPFINCTNCGPRFTIIEDIPYDRAKTTMREFEMCPVCQKEYDDPLDRRFHAQPNACGRCGPHLKLIDVRGNLVTSTYTISKASSLLKRGKILAIRGLGGFQLVCDAANEMAVTRLRKRKRRPAKPFAVMVATLEDVKLHCSLSPLKKGYSTLRSVQ